MSMQREARWSGMKHAILAWPKHDMAQWSAGLGWPGPMEQAVSGPILRHVGGHGTARRLQLGTTSAR